MGDRLASGHNRHQPNIRGAVPPFFGEGELDAHVALWPGPRPTFIPSGILIHPAVCHNRHGPKIGGL